MGFQNVSLLASRTSVSTNFYDCGSGSGGSRGVTPCPKTFVCVSNFIQVLVRGNAQSAAQAGRLSS